MNLSIYDKLFVGKGARVIVVSRDEGSLEGVVAASGLAAVPVRRTSPTRAAVDALAACTSRRSGSRSTIVGHSARWYVRAEPNRT